LNEVPLFSLVEGVRQGDVNAVVHDEYGVAGIRSYTSISPSAIVRDTVPPKTGPAVMTGSGGGEEEHYRFGLMEISIVFKPPDLYTGPDRTLQRSF
jgi:hypothetical protein